MRLLACQLQRVRLHGTLQLHFAPGITLVGGGNETGKSTLVEALHRTLFLRASATGAPVEALQSRLHLGPPEVVLNFEARQTSWTLRKRFSGSSGQVSLQSAAANIRASGAAAEELLAELLGVTETLGSRQANTLLPGRWAHLWVMQGSAGQDLLAAGRNHYDFDTLRSELERLGGAAVLQSDHDQRVIARLEEAIAENFTSRGTRRHSPLWQAEQAVNAAKVVMERALARLQEHQQAGEELVGLTAQLEQLQQTSLPGLLEQQQQLSRAVEASQQWQAAIRLATQTLEPIRLRHEATTRILSEGKTLARGNRERQQRLDQLRRAQEEASSRQKQLSDSLQQQQQERSRLDAQRRQLRQQADLVQGLLLAAQQQIEIQRLNQDLALCRQRQSSRLALQQRLAALPPLGPHQIQQLRERQQHRRDARTRQEAMAAGLRLLRADQPVRLDGALLQPGEERLLSAPFQLEVGDGVALQISPGGGQTLESLARQRQQAEQALQELLQNLGVTGLEQAEQLADERARLEQQLASLGPASDADAERLEALLTQLRQQQSDLEASLADQADRHRDLEQPQPIATEISALQTRQRQLAQTLVHTEAALGRAEAAEQGTQAALQQLLVEQQQRSGQLMVLQEEANARQQQLQELVQTHGGSEVLSQRLAELAAQRQQQEEALVRLQAELAASAAGEAAPQQLQAMASRIDAVRRQIEQLIEQRGAARQRCDSLSEDDPHAAEEQARVQLEQAEREHRAIARLCTARQRLQQLFQEAQADHSSRYSEPLARAIDSYLQPLLPGGPATRLHYDQSNGFTGLELQRGDQSYTFQELSGGMREQLAAALRLSMADVLKGAHDGCLPLLFDDAFTNSDPQRVALVKDMLRTAAARGLQVILLTCDPTAYGNFADQVVTLDDPRGGDSPTPTA